MHDKWSKTCIWDTVFIRSDPQACTGQYSLDAPCVIPQQQCYRNRSNWPVPGYLRHPRRVQRIYETDTNCGIHTTKSVEVQLELLAITVFFSSIDSFHQYIFVNQNKCRFWFDIHWHVSNESSKAATKMVREYKFCILVLCAMLHSCLPRLRAALSQTWLRILDTNWKNQVVPSKFRWAFFSQ